MGVDPVEAEAAIRVSLGWNSVQDDIERLIEAWQELYTRVTHSDYSRARAA
jgi:cysteine desulfurase